MTKQEIDNFYSRISRNNLVNGGRKTLDQKYSYLKIRKIEKDLPDIVQAHKGEWYDLYSAETVTLKAGDYRRIRLGVAMKLPDRHEAIIAARSSTFERYGIIMPSGIGVVDYIYSGDDDEWCFPAIAMRDTFICKGDRICQFRIQPQQPRLYLQYVKHLDSVNRGGFGSTGR